MSELDRLEVFAQIAKLGSITRAAEQLGVSKPALSRQLKRLESDLKVDLFTRKNLRLHLTETGKILLSQCERLQRELDDTRAICRGFHEEPIGDLHVVALEFFAKKYIYPKLNEFMKQYPKLNIFIDTSERVPDFEKDKIDVAVGFTLTMPDDIVQRKMETFNYVMAASKQYLDLHGRPEKLKDLLEHDYIGHVVREEVRTTNLKKPHQLRVKPRMVLNRVENMIDCAKLGLGIVQLPTYLLDASLADGSLEEVLSEYQATEVGVYCYYPRFRYIQPKVRKFIDFMLD